MGGLLSNPATKFPWWFDTPFHHKFPYFLPCFVAALIAFAGCIYGYFYLGEVRNSMLLRRASAYVLCRHILTCNETAKKTFKCRNVVTARLRNLQNQHLYPICCPFPSSVLFASVGLHCHSCKPSSLA